MTTGVHHPSSTSSGGPDRAEPSDRLRGPGVSCAELGLLAGMVLLERGLTPLAKASFPRDVEAYAAVLGVILAGSYVVLTALLWRGHRRRQAPGAGPTPSPQGAPPSALAAAVRRAAPAVIAMAMVLAPYSIARGRGWVVLTTVLAVAWAVTEWLAYRAQWRQPRADGQDDAGLAALPGPVADDLRDLARRRGLEAATIALAPQRGRPEPQARADAACLPTRPQPTFVLSPTLLDLLSPAELRAVFAHEVAHHEMAHSAKAMLASVARTFAAVMLTAGVLLAVEPAQGGQWQVIGLAPALLLTWYLIFAGLQVGVLAYERFLERQACRRALEITGDANAMIRGLRRIAEYNGWDRQPSRWRKWLFAAGPSLADVLALARRFAAGRGPEPAQAPDAPSGPGRTPTRGAP